MSRVSKLKSCSHFPYKSTATI